MMINLHEIFSSCSQKILI